jgi:hypothetical protein
MTGFKRPFKAVPLKSKRLKGLDELNKPLWTPPQAKQPINRGLVAIGLFIGVCLGLAFVLGGW